MSDIVKIENLEKVILEVRGVRVLIDSDVAQIYGVETRDINKAVTNNPDKFPSGYIVELTKTEKSELVENFHRFEKLKHSTVNPKAFTEKGLYNACHHTQESGGDTSNHLNHRNLHQNPRTIQKRQRTLNHTRQGAAKNTHAAQR